MSIDEITRAAAAGASEPEVEGRLWALWGEVVAAAAGGEPLEELVKEVTGVLEIERRLFGAQMREAWNLVPPDDRDVESWTRLNEFAARLTAARVDFSLFGLWSIGTALETFAPPSLHLPAAVAWFEHCGPELASATRHRRTFGPGPGRLHVLAEREGLSETGFNPPRWAFWRSRLDTLATDGDPVARAGLRALRRLDKHTYS